MAIFFRSGSVLKGDSAVRVAEEDITESEKDLAAKRERERRFGIGEGQKSLAQQLAERKAQQDEHYLERQKYRPTRALDSDEVEFLAETDRLKREQALKRKQAESEDLAEFQNVLLEAGAGEAHAAAAAAPPKDDLLQLAQTLVSQAGSLPISLALSAATGGAGKKAVKGAKGSAPSSAAGSSSGAFTAQPTSVRAMLLARAAASSAQQQQQLQKTVAGEPAGEKRHKGGAGAANGSAEVQLPAPALGPTASAPAGAAAVSGPAAAAPRSGLGMLAGYDSDDEDSSDDDEGAEGEG